MKIISNFYNFQNKQPVLGVKSIVMTLTKTILKLKFVKSKIICSLFFYHSRPTEEKLGSVKIPPVADRAVTDRSATNGRV